MARTPEPFRRFRFRLLPLVLLMAAGPAGAQGVVAVKGGRVVPVSGPPIDGGVVLIRDGKVEAVGKGLAIPSGARVIDAAGKVVMPGFIEAHSSRGMDQANERNPNIPYASVLDAIDPSQEYFEECRRNGVTAVAIVPGNETMIGGQAAILKTAGTYVDEMVVQGQAGIKISLQPASGRSRMSHLASLREELDAARAYLQTGKVIAARTPTETEASPEGGEGGDEPEREEPGGPGRPGGPTTPVDARVRHEALSQVLKGQPAFLYCDAAMDVPRALELVREYKLKPILILGKDCHKAAKEVAAAKLPVILDPTLVFWETDPRTGKDGKVVLPKVYREAGVPILFQVTGLASGGLGRAPSLPPTLGTNYLWYQAATAVKYGMPREEAVEAITLRPAQVLGIDKTAGSIEPGKDADLVILTGDPLKIDTWVDKTLIRGEVVYDRAEDTKFRELLEPTK